MGLEILSFLTAKEQNELLERTLEEIKSNIKPDINANERGNLLELGYQVEASLSRTGAEEELARSVIENLAGRAEQVFTQEQLNEIIPDKFSIDNIIENQRTILTSIKEGLENQRTSGDLSVSETDTRVLFEEAITDALAMLDRGEAIPYDDQTLWTDFNPFNNLFPDGDIRTIKGWDDLEELAQQAEEYGISVPDPEINTPTPQPQPDPAPQPEPDPDPQPEPDPAPQPEPDPDPQPEPDPDPQPQPDPDPQPEPDTDYEYTIQQGDMLYAIALAAGTNVQDIMEANEGNPGVINENLILAGYGLNMPEGIEAPTPEEVQKYISGAPGEPEAETPPETQAAPEIKPEVALAPEAEAAPVPAAEPEKICLEPVERLDQEARDAVAGHVSRHGQNPTSEYYAFTHREQVYITDGNSAYEMPEEVNLPVPLAVEKGFGADGDAKQAIRQYKETLKEAQEYGFDDRVNAETGVLIRADEAANGASGYFYFCGEGDDMRGEYVSEAALENNPGGRFDNIRIVEHTDGGNIKISLTRDFTDCAKPPAPAANDSEYNLEVCGQMTGTFNNEVNCTGQSTAERNLETGQPKVASIGPEADKPKPDPSADQPEPEADPDDGPKPGTYLFGSGIRLGPDLDGLGKRLPGLGD